MMKILLLEDDALLAESLREYLEMEGYEVEAVAYGEEVFDRTFDERYDLYILDINVPDVNGLEVLRELKAAEDETPAIYISAMTDISTISEGFDAGAIDYIKKPFDPEELVLRIRHHMGGRESTQRYGELSYDPAAGCVEIRGERYTLGEVQKRIFDLLIDRVGETVGYDELMEQMERPSPNALRVSMAKLKKKLGISIRNVRGQGYMLEAL